MMVILRENVRGLGSVGDVVKVKPGYARNFLVPTGKAKFATKTLMKQVELEREELRRSVAGKVSRFRDVAEVLRGKVVFVVSKASDADGKLYGAVKAGAIFTAIVEAYPDLQGFLEKSNVSLDEPIRHLGKYEVDVSFCQGVGCSICLYVVSSLSEADDILASLSARDAASDGLESVSGEDQAKPELDSDTGGS